MSSNVTRLELTIQVDLEKPEELQRAGLELRTQLRPDQWEALLLLSREVCSVAGDRLLHREENLRSVASD